MYCTNCGKEIQEEWVKCPYCKNETISAKMSNLTNNNFADKKEKTNSDVEMNVTVEKMNDRIRLLLKALAIVAIVCFFCPLYMVSCAGEELFSVSGVDIAFGLEYMDEKIEGNIIFGLLLIIPPVYNFTAAFVNTRKLVKQNAIGILKFTSYSIAISSGTLITLISYITFQLQSNVEEIALNITPNAALYIMFIVSIISVGVGGYLAYSYEQQSWEERKTNRMLEIAKCSGKVCAGSFALFMLIAVLASLPGDSRPSTDPEDYIRDWAVVGTENETDTESDSDSNEIEDNDVLESDEEVQKISNEDEYIFIDSDKKYLSEEEVRSVEVDKLILGRNEIFARHGRVFNDADIAAYFAQQPWYQGTVPAESFNPDVIFNDFEKKNVELIQRIEVELSGGTEESEKQAVIDDALYFVSGEKFHVKDSQGTIEFTPYGEFIVYGYYGTSYSPTGTNDYHTTYSFSADYVLHKDVWQYLVSLNIDGVEYYFRYFTNGDISLEGAGEFSSWYEML